MRALFVNENINFQKGLDPKASIGIGIYEKTYRDFRDFENQENYDIIVSEDTFDVDEEEDSKLLEKALEYLNVETEIYKEFETEEDDEVQIRISPYGPILIIANAYQILSIFCLKDRKDEIIKELKSYDK
jgi:hypothetical protein